MSDKVNGKTATADGGWTEPPRARRNTIVLAVCVIVFGVAATAFAATQMRDNNDRAKAEAVRTHR